MYLKRFLVALVVPNPETSTKWLSSNGFTNVTINDLCDSQEMASEQVAPQISSAKKAFKEMVFANMQKHGRESGLMSFEQVMLI